ncbi:MAG: hypothetical protein JJ979_03300 [Roseibium sp.]|nr:hypothetical protein [Roseibium sp.]
MFVPNNKGELSSQEGHNVYGEPAFDPPVTVQCGVVRLNHTSQKTSVRTDSSASRGAAEESVASSKILFPADLSPVIGDKFEISGISLRIFKIEPRYSITGVLDHWECELEAWGE